MMRIFAGGRELHPAQRIEPTFAIPAAAPRKRGFDGAKHDRLTRDFLYSHASMDAELRRFLRPLRGRWRELEQNNDYARAWLRSLRRNVIGPTGIHFVNAAQLAGGKLDKETNKAVQAAWSDWCKKENCTVDGKLSFLALSWVWLTSVARDGEALIRIIGGFQNKYGFALQPLEADYLDENFNVDLPNGNRIRMGIEIDPWARPVAYHLFKTHPGEWGYAPAPMQGRERVPADQILHGFMTDRFGQTRGVPWGHSAMRRLFMMGKYEEYALVAARIGAGKAGFYEQKDPASGDPWSQPGAEQKTDQGDLVREVNAGEFEALPPGWTFKEFNPEYPTQNYGPFIKTMLRGAASGLVTSYEPLSNDRENVNYSSIRAGMLDERDEWRLLQCFTSDGLHNAVHVRFLPFAILSGQLKARLLDLERISVPIWHGRGWAWVDPQKEIDALTRAVALRVMSRKRIAAQIGVEIEDIAAELAEEAEIFKDAGVALVDPVPSGSLNKPPQDAQAEEPSGSGVRPAADETD